MEQTIGKLREAEDFVTKGADWMGVDIRALRSGRRGEDLVWARELLMLLVVERYRLKVKDLAGQLRKFTDGMSQTRARAARRRTEDTALRRGLTRLGRAMADAGARRPSRIAE